MGCRHVWLVGAAIIASPVLVQAQPGIDSERGRALLALAPAKSDTAVFLDVSALVGGPLAEEWKRQQYERAFPAIAELRSLIGVEPWSLEHILLVTIPDRRPSEGAWMLVAREPTGARHEGRAERVVPACGSRASECGWALARTREHLLVFGPEERVRDVVRSPSHDPSWLELARVREPVWLSSRGDELRDSIRRSSNRLISGLGDVDALLATARFDYEHDVALEVRVSAPDPRHAARLLRLADSVGTFAALSAQLGVSSSSVQIFETLRATRYERDVDLSFTVPYPSFERWLYLSVASGWSDSGPHP